MGAPGEDVRPQEQKSNREDMPSRDGPGPGNRRENGTSPAASSWSG